MESKIMSGNLPKEVDKITFNTIEEAIQDIKDGKLIIVVDDEDRENEGDFICAAECVTPEIINFMATHGRGLICAPLDERRADELDLPMMVSANTALHETAFTVSIDLIGHGCTTGISAYDRATGIRKLTDPNTVATDYARPGHIFPLRAKQGGVLRRTGHTEAAIDLAKLAGFSPVGVLVEILNADGSMARLPQLTKIAREHSLKIIAIKDLVAYRMVKERLIKEVVRKEVQTKFGAFTVFGFEQLTTGDVHFAVKKGDWEPGEPILVRVHSGSEMGEIFGSMFDNYAEKLQAALQLICAEGKGLLLYMRHGEKGNTASLLNRLTKHGMQEAEGKADMLQRDYGVGAQVLRDMGITKFRLITNSPKKRIGLIGYGLEIIENVGY